jgi:hypothetical protein
MPRETTTVYLANIGEDEGDFRQFLANRAVEYNRKIYGIHKDRLFTAKASAVEVSVRINNTCDNPVIVKLNMN